MAPRQAGLGSSNYPKNHLRGDGNLSAVKDATVRRECSTSAPSVEDLESRKLGGTDSCTRDHIQVGVWPRGSK
jgi:hypothetical protein